MESIWWSSQAVEQEWEQGDPSSLRPPSNDYLYPIGFSCTILESVTVMNIPRLALECIL
jgi:hypothetical protein